MLVLQSGEVSGDPMGRWIQRLRRYRRLTPADKRLYARAWCLLWRVRMALWVLPYRAWRKRYVTASTNAGSPAETEMRGEAPGGADTLDRVSWAVLHASRFVPGARTCLVQAIAAQRLLHRMGLPASLHLGVRRSAEGELQAHAWVRSGTVVVVGGEEECPDQAYQSLGKLEDDSAEEPTPTCAEREQAT